MLGELRCRLEVVDKTDARRPEDYAGEEEAEDGRQVERAHQRRHQRHRQQQDLRQAWAARTTQGRRADPRTRQTEEEEFRCSLINGTGLIELAH